MKLQTDADRRQCVHYAYYICLCLWLTTLLYFYINTYVLLFNNLYKFMLLNSNAAQAMSNIACYFE